MPFDLTYLLLIVASLVLGYGTQAYIKSQYNKFSKVSISSGLTGAQTARRMLDANGLADVPIRSIPGNLTDHFDPRSRVVSLSANVYEGRSVAATAVACHECGHAVQHARDYAPAKIRSLLVPAVQLASNLWAIALMIGIVLNFLGLIWAAVGMYAAVLLFQLVTLPVEFNASSRALAYISLGGYLPDQETRGARKVLTAAALTYVAGALLSVIQLIYILGRTRRR